MASLRLPLMGWSRIPDLGCNPQHRASAAIMTGAFMITEDFDRRGLRSGRENAVGQVWWEVAAEAQEGGKGGAGGYDCAQGRPGQLTHDFPGPWGW
jgi:hypothetical protein